MKIFLRVLGWIAIALALIMVAAEIDDAQKGKTENRAVGIAMMIIFGGAGLMLLRAGSRPKEAPRADFPASPPPPRAQTPSEPKRPDDDFI